MKDAALALLVILLAPCIGVAISALANWLQGRLRPTRRKDIMTTIAVPMQNDRYNDQGKFDLADGAELRILCADGRRRAFGFGYVDETGTCRRVFQGPVGPGPYAYVYGRAVVIAREPIAGPTNIIECQAGDILTTPDGERFEIRPVKFDRENFRREHLTDSDGE